MSRFSSLSESSAFSPSRFLKSATGQAVALAVLLGVTLGAWTYSSQREKEARIPVAFSEIGKILTQHERSGKPLSPLTPYYAKTNDMVMQVFEASNTALRSNRKHFTFATELEMRLDRTFRVHKQLDEYVKEIPDLAQKALVSVSKLVSLRNALPKVVGNLSSLWSERHDDVSHQEERPVCDLDGKNCKMDTVDVYDYTVHHYWYDDTAGRATPLYLGELYQNVPDVVIGDRLSLATRTDAENEYAIEVSQKEDLNGKIPTDEQALRAANVWATGSNYIVYAPRAHNDYEKLRGMAQRWGFAMRDARSESYPTGQHEDSGPQEYRFSNQALALASDAQASAAKVVDGIVFAQQNAPVLEKKVRAYIGVVLDHKPGNADRLRREVMDTAQSIYERNFDNGYDVRPFKWWKVLTAAAAGAVAGTALVLGGYAFVERMRMRRSFNAARFG